MTPWLLNGEFEKLGSVSSVSSNHDLISMTLLSLKENFNRSLELLSKIILTPRFEEKDFTREKKKVTDRILQLKDEPSFIASSVFDKRVFGDTYYASPEIGYENSVNAISNNDIKIFYRDNITAANTKFIVVGNLTEAEAVDQFNKYLGGWNTTLNSSSLLKCQNEILQVFILFIRKIQHRVRYVLVILPRDEALKILSKQES